MFLVSNGTQVAAPSAPAAVSGVPGYYTNGIPGVQAPTDVDQDVLNMFLQELLAIVTAAGIAPSKSNNAQVLASLNKLFSAINGSSSQQFNVANGTASNNAVNLSQLLGLFGTTSGNLAGSRYLTTIYTNTTGRPMFVSGYLTTTSTGTNTILTVSGQAVWVQYSGLSSIQCSFIGMVPAGGTYELTNSSGGTITTWQETQ